MLWKEQAVTRLYRFSDSVKKSRIGKSALIRGLGRDIRQELLRFLTARKTVLVRIDGLSLRIFTTPTFIENYLHRSYEAYTVRLFKAAIRPQSTVLDLGANVGYFSLIAARQASLGGRVYSFEPDPTNLAVLTLNVKMNGFSNITTVQKAVGNQVKPMTFILAESSDMNSFSAHPLSPAQSTLVVECTTVDQFMDGASVDVVKMDVEGYEPLALEGMKNTIARSRNMVMFVEFNPSCLRANGFPPEALFLKLEELGFEVSTIDEDLRSVKPITIDFLRTSEDNYPGWFVNLYCVKKTLKGE